MAAKEKTLTGRHVLIMLLAFFGVMVAVNTVFTVAAVQTFRGEDVPRSYRQGLEYNQTLSARSEQQVSGWTANVNHVKTADENKLMLDIVSATGQSIDGLEITAVLRHSVDGNFDRDVLFARDGEHWAAEIDDDLSGRWTLVATASKGSSPFKMEYELWF